MTGKKEKLSSPGNGPNGTTPGRVPPADGAVGQKIFFAGAGLSFLISLVIYWMTMAVSSSFWDSGEFIATSYTLGIPHSPGTPLYVLVGRVFTLLPLPLSIAQKVNFLSVLCGALGILFIYLLIVRFLEYISGPSKTTLDTTIKVIGGLVGGLFLTFSSTYWTNATEAEVYAMSCFLMGFMTWLGLRWAKNPEGPRAASMVFLLFYLLAMSVGFHMGTILAFSGIFFFVWMTQKKTFTNLEFLIACIGVGIFVADATLYRNGRITLALVGVFTVLVIWLYYTRSPFAAICAGLFILGLSVHLYLLIRSGHNPDIDEGDPETWKALYAVLRREQYPPINPFVRKASYAFQFQHFNNYYQSQFAMFTYHLGKLNLGAVLPIGVGIWGMVDHLTKHRKSFVMLFVTFLVTSLGLIIFLNFSDEEVRERDYFYSPAFYYFAVFIGIGAASIMTEVRNQSAKRGAGAIYATGAVLLIFPLLTAHHHYFTHNRSHNYTCRDYAVNMLKPLQQNAVIFTNGDNDTFPLWYIQEVERYRRDVRVVNLSLLNTPWYIRQLRDNEPKLPITWSDEEINMLQPIPSKSGWLLVRDLGVRHILRENKWRLPIYFAVTIPSPTYAPYRDYLEMQGLVYLLVQKKGSNMINEQVLEDNIYHQFSYRSILTKDWKKDRSVYLPDYTLHLIQNYALAFVQLGYLQQDDPVKGLRSFEIASEISPQMEPVKQLLGRFYFMAGDTQAALRNYEEMTRQYPDDPAIFYRAAEIYERVNNFDKALQCLNEVLRLEPGDRQTMLSAYGVSLRANRLGQARNYLTAWLNAHPNDEEVKARLEEFDAAVKAVPVTPQPDSKEE